MDEPCNLRTLTTLVSRDLRDRESWDESNHVVIIRLAVCSTASHVRALDGQFELAIGPTMPAGAIGNEGGAPGPDAPGSRRDGARETAIGLPP